MDSEVKRAMKLMSGNKVYKAAFGWHPVCFIFYVIVAIICGGGFILDKLVGEVSTNGEVFFFSMMPAMLFLFFGAYFGSQSVVILLSGKSLLSFPIAKTALTKGLVANRLLSFLICAVPAVGMRLVCVALDFCEVSVLDDMLVGFGVAYVVAMIAEGCNGFNMVLPFFIGFLGLGSAALKKVFGNKLSPLMDAAVDYVMTWWLVVIIFAVLVIGGTWLGTVVLERNYKKRKVVYNTLEMRVAQR